VHVEHGFPLQHEVDGAAQLVGQDGQGLGLAVLAAEFLIEHMRRTLWDPVDPRLLGSLDSTLHARVNGGMAVVVQRMVDATAAGVIFTADPVTGEGISAAIESGTLAGRAILDGGGEPSRVGEGYDRALVALRREVRLGRVLARLTYDLPRLRRWPRPGPGCR